MPWAALGGVVLPAVLGAVGLRNQVRSSQKSDKQAKRIADEQVKALRDQKAREDQMAARGILPGSSAARGQFGSVLDKAGITPVELAIGGVAAVAVLLAIRRRRGR